MTTLLDQIHPGLTDLLDSLTAAQLRTVARVVCVLALRETALYNEVIVDGLRALRAGQYGSRPLRERLRTLVEELDEAGWVMLDALDSGCASRREYAAAFAAARGANALFVALNTDARRAAGEVLYEVSAAIGAQQEANLPIEDSAIPSPEDVLALQSTLGRRLMAAVQEALQRRRE